MGTTFFLTVIAWVFFRSDNVKEAFQYMGGMVGNTHSSNPMEFSTSFTLILFGFIFAEWFGREGQYAMAKLDWFPKFIRYSIYSSIILLLFVFAGKQQEFIYFQF